MSETTCRRRVETFSTPENARNALDRTSGRRRWSSKQMACRGKGVDDLPHARRGAGRARHPADHGGVSSSKSCSKARRRRCRRSSMARQSWRSTPRATTAPWRRRHRTEHRRDGRILAAPRLAGMRTRSASPNEVIGAGLARALAAMGGSPSGGVCLRGGSSAPRAEFKVLGVQPRGFGDPRPSDACRASGGISRADGRRSARDDLPSTVEKNPVAFQQRAFARSCCAPREPRHAAHR